MAKYISKDLMLENLKSDLEHHANDCEPLTVLIMQRFIKYVENFPSVDLEPPKEGDTNG